MQRRKIVNLVIFFSERIYGNTEILKWLLVLRSSTHYSTLPSLSLASLRQIL
jgi:hypothetical protein